MPVKKLQIQPGVNRENTRYTTEGGWYECDKIRFRQGNPEKIGGWTRTSDNTYLGVCRSLWSWSLLGGAEVQGVGTNLKFYIDSTGTYHDVTPIRSTTSAGDVTFGATNGSTTLDVTDTAHGAVVGDYVTFSGAVTLGGNVTAAVLNQEHTITVITDADNYEVELSVTANASDTGNGGASVVGEYQVNVGPEISTPLGGWGSGPWGSGTWGNSSSSTESLRIWNQGNFGEDLIAGVRGDQLYYWDATGGFTTRMVFLSSLGGASDVPTEHNLLLVSDVSRFVFVFGCNVISTSTFDPMLIRWSAQEDAADWTPLATNQAGSLRLSNGSRIVAVKQARQEILVWTDKALYSLQYYGPPEGWGAQLVGENISIISAAAVSWANGMAYWMGEEHFHVYSGRVEPLPCDLRRFVFSDLNADQYDQIFSGTNEAFHEIWWFYCSATSTTVDKYVIYNYLEGIWYYGTLARTAWLDDAYSGAPLAATYSNNLVLHEVGTDDETAATAEAINAYILSSQFDIDDGDRFAFIWRLLPDISFEGSSNAMPSVDMTIYPLKNSGSGYNSPLSEGGNSSLPVTRSATVPVEQYTEQLNIRVRGRQMSIRVESDEIGTTWQLGNPRIDLRPDGRRG